ncbi:hypothetical protein SR39_02835 [Methylobacterium radiotolerans]|nr:hypothetical protein SR39_02835 [Methylobacterium radiotolerans]
MIRRLAERGALAALALTLSGLAGWAAEENDYPTDARVDYVFGCMAANGQTRESLQKCSCSLDQLAAILPYDKYVQASTVLSMRQGIATGRTSSSRPRSSTTRSRSCAAPRPRPRSAAIAAESNGEAGVAPASRFAHTGSRTAFVNGTRL